MMSLTNHQKKLLDFDKRPTSKRIRNLPKSTLEARRAIEAKRELKQIENDFSL